MIAGTFKGVAFSLCTLGLLGGAEALGQPIPFAGHSYELVSVPTGLTWVDAAYAAYDRKYLGVGGHLVSINSAAENAFLYSAFSGSSLDTVWIDGMYRLDTFSGSSLDNGTSGVEDVAAALFWRQSGARVSYLNWATGEPNDFSGINPSVDIEIALHNGGTWIDRPASAVSFGYIMEYYVVPEPSTWSLCVLAGLGISFARKRFRNRG